MLTEEQLNEIDARAACLYEYVDLPEEADVLAGTDVPALIALVREQQARIDSADQAFVAMAQANGGIRDWSGDQVSHVARIMSALRGDETPHRVAYNRVWAEVRRLRTKLDAPCGSCHPCTNYRDETWRAAGRRPPHVYEWDGLKTKLAEIERIAFTGGQDAASVRRYIQQMFADGEQS